MHWKTQWSELGMLELCAPHSVFNLYIPPPDITWKNYMPSGGWGTIPLCNVTILFSCSPCLFFLFFFSLSRHSPPNYHLENWKKNFTRTDRFGNPVVKVRGNMGAVHFPAFHFESG